MFNQIQLTNINLHQHHVNTFQTIHKPNLETEQNYQGSYDVLICNLKVTLGKIGQKSFYSFLIYCY